MRYYLFSIILLFCSFLFGATISGSVSNDTGNLVFDAQVVLIEMSENNGSFSPIWQQTPLIADSFGEGSYYFEEVTAGHYILYAIAPLYDATYYNNSDNWQDAVILSLLEDSFLENIDFELPATAVYEINGLVSDYNTDTIPEVMFNIISLKQNFFPYTGTATNNEGFYQVFIPAGDYIFAVSHMTENQLYEVLFYEHSHSFLSADIVHFDQYTADYNMTYDEPAVIGNYLSGDITGDWGIPEYPVYISVSSEEDDWEKTTLMHPD